MKENLTADFFRDFFCCSAHIEGTVSRMVPAAYRLSLLSDLMQWDAEDPKANGKADKPVSHSHQLMSR